MDGMDGMDEVDAKPSCGRQGIANHLVASSLLTLRCVPSSLPRLCGDAFVPLFRRLVFSTFDVYFPMQNLEKMRS